MVSDRLARAPRKETTNLDDALFAASLAQAEPGRASVGKHVTADRLLGVLNKGLSDRSRGSEEEKIETERAKSGGLPCRHPREAEKEERNTRR